MLTKTQQKVLDDLKKDGARMIVRTGAFPLHYVWLPNDQSYRLRNFKTYWAIRRVARFTIVEEKAFTRTLAFVGMKESTNENI